MSMTRRNAGFATGLVGAVVSILLAIFHLPVIGLIIGLLVPVAVGIVAGILVAKNPTYAGKTGGAGAITGLIAGAVLFVGLLVGGALKLSSPDTQNNLNVAVSDVQATATAQASSGSSSRSGNVDYKTAAEAGFEFLYCIGGLLSLGVATGLGAAAGAIAGRGNAAPPVNPYGQYGAVPPYGAPQQPQMYNPPQTGSPYGSQQPPMYNPPPASPPQNDGTQ